MALLAGGFLPGPAAGAAEGAGGIAPPVAGNLPWLVLPCVLAALSWWRHRIRQRRRACELRDLQERLAWFAGHAHDAVLVFDPEWRVIDANDRAAEMYGYTRNELLALGAGDLGDPAGPEWHVQAAAAADATLEFVHRRKGGAGFPAECSLRNLTRGGRPHVLALIGDVTGRRRVEAELRGAREAAERRAAELTAIMEAVPAAVFVGHGEDCREMSGNRVAHELLGLPAGRNLSATATAAAGPAPAFRLQRQGRDLPAGALPVQTAARGLPVRDCEIEVVRADGSVRTLFGNAVPLPDASGRPRGAVGAFVDITDRKRSERALRERESIFSSIVDQAVEGIALIEAESGRIVEFNAAAHRNLGYSSAGLAATRAADLLEGRSEELMRAKIAETIRVGALTMEGVLRHRNGDLLDVRISARHLVLDGRDYVAAIWSDISASKRTERELQAARRMAERAAADLAAIMDAVPAAVFIAQDPECRTITGNSVTRKLLRLPPGANISKSAPAGDGPVNFRTFKDGREIPAGELPVQQAARGIVVTGNELDLVFDDGTVCTTLGDARPLFDADGQLRGAVAVFFDITERKRMEQSVREGRDLLAETQKIARIGSWEIDHRHDRLSWSDEIFNLFELAPPAGDAGRLLKPLGDGQRAQFHALIHPEDRARVESTFAEALRQRTVFSVVHRILFPDGRVKVVSESARHYYAADGTPLRSLGTVIDITVRYEAEEALRRNERVLSAIFEGASIGICYADVQRGIQKVNARLCSLLGYSEVELQMLDYRAYTTPEDVTVEEEQIHAIREGRSEGFVREKRFVRKDGTSFWGNLGLSASRDRAGRLSGYVVIIEDITERRQARESLRQFNAELEQRVAARSSEIQGLLDSIPDTVLICDADGKTVSCHPPRSAAPPAFIAECPACDGRGCTNPVVAGVVAEVCALVRDAGQATVHECDREFAGTLYSLEARAAPVGSGRVLILLRDISQRKRLEREVHASLERERQLSEMKSQFISVASHEFRTPLAAAVSTAQLLERYGERITPEKRRVLILRLERSLHRLTEIINDVLVVSRVDAKRLAVHRVPTDLGQLVREVINEVGEGDRLGHAFDFRPSGAPGTVLADVKLLHHIFSNVIGNAVKYSPEGTTVRIALHVGEGDFTLTVADEGIGVPPGEEGRIFEPFGRASNVGEIGGTGLGLDIVRRFTELMGGRIDLVPSAKGATFRINIPLNAGEAYHVAA